MTSRSSHGRRVLIVEEDHALRTAAAIFLRRAGYEVDEAADEVTGLQLLIPRLAPYAVVIVGVRLDTLGVVGGRLVSHAQAAHPRLPVVVWSTDPQPTSGTQLLHWLRRPWLPEDLLRVVARATSTSLPPPTAP